jgi:hypothetical protein
VTTPDGRDRKRKALGAASVCLYAAHLGQCLYRRETENAFWICHLGSLLVGIGLLTRNGTLNAIGTLWLLIGLPLWIYDLIKVGDWSVTSVLTHVLGPIIGLLGVRMLGMPTGIWWKSVAGLVPVFVLSRLLTPPAANINLSHAIYPGSEALFPNYPVYIAALTGLYAGGAFGFQGLARRLGWKPPEPA